MTCIFESVYYGGTRLDGVSGQWTRTVTKIDVGDLEDQQDRIGAGLRHGEIEIAESIPRGIPITLTVRSYMTGSVTNLYGAERDEVAAIRAILRSAGATEAFLKTTRKDGSNTDQTREIRARVLGSPHHKIIQPRGGSGSLVKPGNGVVEVVARLYARFPYWRDATEQLATDSAESAAGGFTLTAGDVAPAGIGARFSLASGVNLPAVLTITNSTTGSEFVINVGATVSDGDDYIDWFHTDPTGYDSAFSHADTYVAVGGSFLVDPGANTITARTTTGGDEVEVDLSYWKYYLDL